MSTSLPSASIVENVRFNRTVIVPNALQGLFKKRPGPIKIATAMDVDGEGIRLLSSLRDKHGGKPVWVRVVTDPALLLLSVDDVREALEGSPDPFAPDPEAKKVGMSHFQPDALTISRGEVWADRRRWAEAVLGAAPRSRLEAVMGEEIGAMTEFDFDALHHAFQRFTRRMVFGDGAADDARLSELLETLMDQANGRPSQQSKEFAAFETLVGEYVEGAEDGSLAGAAADVPVSAETRPERQFTHWLFATGDTLALNVWRALALLATYPDEEDLSGTLQEAMRLWPTTPMLSRVTLKKVLWHGVEVPAGTQILIVNTFLHRDAERLGDAADRFTPSGWAKGGAFVDDWGLNFFSHGPQVCPGASLAVHLGVVAMRAVLDKQGKPVFDGSPKLEPGADMPAMLDPFALKLALS
jgi:cytochrome P450